MTDAPSRRDWETPGPGEAYAPQRRPPPVEGRSTVGPNPTAPPRVPIDARERNAPVRGLLVIGASTGGPKAIQSVLAALPSPFVLPIIAIQHIGRDFAAGFAAWLASATTHAIHVPDDGEPLVPGIVYVAPGDTHLTVAGRTVHLDGGERRHHQRPSVDTTFESAAHAFGRRTIAVILTGMGRDGADGCHAVRTRGGVVLAQDEATSVVYGMPRVAAEMGAVDAVLPLDAIGMRIREETRRLVHGKV